jgi:hypothetical protein
MVVVLPFVTVETLVPMGKSLIMAVLLGNVMMVGTALGSTVAVTIMVPVAVPAMALEHDNNSKIRYLISSIIYLEFTKIFHSLPKYFQYSRLPQRKSCHSKYQYAMDVSRPTHRFSA